MMNMVTQLSQTFVPLKKKISAGKVISQMCLRAAGSEIISSRLKRIINSIVKIVMISSNFSFLTRKKETVAIKMTMADILTMTPV